jgi:K+-sensing histidine kinase KdpD
MRKSNDYILTLRPWSWSTFVVALLAVGLATAMQEGLASFGMQLSFAGFAPAILIAGLLGGAPAGAFATVISVPVVWWVFMPPYFQFAWPSADDYDRLSMFLLSSALLVCFSQLYREALGILRK